MTASFPERQSTSGGTIEMLLPVSTVTWQGLPSIAPVATSPLQGPSPTPVLYTSLGALVSLARLCPTSLASGRFPGSLGLVMEVALAFPVSQVWLGWGSSGIAK